MTVCNVTTASNALPGLQKKKIEIYCFICIFNFSLISKKKHLLANLFVTSRRYYNLIGSSANYFLINF